MSGQSHVFDGLSAQYWYYLIILNYHLNRYTSSHYIIVER